MAEIKPFHGCRFDPAVAGSMGKLIAPPYDVIDEAQRRNLFHSSPYNIARVTKADRQSVPPASSPYEAAGKLFADWRKHAIVKCDATPCVYVYEQFFTVKDRKYSRTGIIALVRLEAPGTGVLPHENTLSGPRRDRLELMRDTHAQFGQVFGLYPPGQDDIEQTLDQVKAARPIVQAVDDAESLHRLWAISDPGIIARIQEAMREKRILIADGHHRYETSLAYQAENPNCEAAKYRMMTLVNMANPGLVILPIHRLVAGVPNFSRAAFLETLRKLFTVRTYPGEGSGVHASITEVLHALQAEGHHAFGLYLGDGNYYVLDLRRLDAIGEISGGSEMLRSLDVTILHQLIFDRILGITAEHLREETNLQYVKDFPYALQEAATRVKSGDAQALFLLNPTRIDEVQTVAQGGERMPQKSTFFYPKAYSGMVLYCMDDTPGGRA